MSVYDDWILNIRSLTAPRRPRLFTPRGIEDSLRLETQGGGDVAPERPDRTLDSYLNPADIMHEFGLTALLQGGGVFVTVSVRVADFEPVVCVVGLVVSPPLCLPHPDGLHLLLVNLPS